MKSRFTLVIAFVAIFSFASSAQMTVVIMGSSTAFGVGASTYDSSWAGRITSYLNKNISDGRDTVFYNIAAPGYDSYQEMPTTFVPPPGRRSPDEAYNITKALSYNPDVVIINLPSNDISYGSSKGEMMSNLRVMSAAAFAQGARCYVATPQPRNDFDQGYRDSLFDLVDSVNNTFGPFAINFWDPLVTTDGLHMLKDELRAGGSPLHINDTGHELLFEQIRDGYIFGLTGPVALRLTSFTGQLQNNAVLLKWHTEEQPANTTFELQKSVDGRNFQTFYSEQVSETRPSADYTTVDPAPFTGRVFYRLKITASQRESFSDMITVSNTNAALSIDRLVVTAGGAQLTAEISVKKSQLVNVTVVSANGAVVIARKDLINQPSQQIIVPIGRLAAGQYYLRIVTNDGSMIVRAFTK